MKFVRFVWQTCRGLLVITMIVAGLSGAWNAGLIALLNTALHHQGPRLGWLLWAFSGLVLAKVLSSFFSQYLLIRFGQEVIARLRQDLVHRVLNVPLRRLEQIGPSKIMAALTDDVANITQAFLGVPICAVNLAMLLGGAVYLAWLSWKLLLIMSVFVLVGGVVYRLLVNRAMHCLRASREMEDKLFQGFRGLTEGIKELKLHRERRGGFLEQQIQQPTLVCQNENVRAETRFILAQNWTHLLFLALIGCGVFLLPKLGPMDPQVRMGFVLTTLYLMGPLAGLLGYISLYGRGNVSLAKVEQLGLSLREQAHDLSPAAFVTLEPAFKRIDILEVTHTYRVEHEEDPFMLGPITLSFRPGEVVFLAGGNGSGKSTFAKIVAGLYLPESGEIRWDGQRVDTRNRDDYRQLFSAVFSDFYIFDSLLGLRGANLDAQARQYLVQLHLQHKVQVKEGVLSTTALSQGQRKRLALLTAYLEDRPFYLFDEWASDQDPLFKEIFYTRLLPDLKSRGKSVLVITHDDKYFHLADRFCKLEDGRLIEDTSHPNGRTMPGLRADLRPVLG